MSVRITQGTRDKARQDGRKMSFYKRCLDLGPGRAGAASSSTNMDDYYTTGWAELRRCAIDGQHILNVAIDITVPCASGGQEEQDKAELRQVHLDCYARRHVGQKIYLRQAAAQRWVEWREQILMGGRPQAGNQSPLRGIDQQLQNELASITDEAIYAELQASDISMGRWTAEDPSLRAVLRWIRSQLR